MTNLSLVPVFMIGLLGGVHCVGMCGGIVAALSVTSGPKLKKEWDEVYIRHGKAAAAGFITEGSASKLLASVKSLTAGERARLQDDIQEQEVEQASGP